MAFMERVIYESDYYEVETDFGTECVPADVVGIGPTVEVEALRDYLEGEPLNNEPVTSKHGWVARMSAPGYMDCTAWSAFDTKQAAEEYLDEYYGDDDDADNCTHKN